MGGSGRRDTGARLAALVTAIAASAGCGATDESRWAAPSDDELAALASLDTEIDIGGDGVDVAVVDIGPVASVDPVRTVLRGADVVFVETDLAGRVQRRLPSPGEDIAAGDPVVELGGEPDDRERLQLDILRLERELAELEGRTDDAERIAVELEALAVEVADGGGEIVAPTGGIFSHHLAGIFSDVEPGDVVAAIATSPAAVASVVDARAAGALELGDLVTVEARTATFDEPVAARVVDIEDDRVTVSIPDDADLAIGQRVVVTLEVPTDDVLRVDERALRRSERGTFVVVVTPDGRWIAVDVAVGARGGGLAEIDDPTGIVADGTEVVLP